MNFDQAWMPVILAVASVYLAYEMKRRGLRKFGWACLGLSITFTAMKLLGIPKDYWRPIVYLWIVAVVVATYLIFRHYQGPIDDQSNSK